MTGFRLADIIEPLGGDRSWYEQAKCRKFKPGEYDSVEQSGIKGYDKSLRIIRVMEKCEGCPVVKQCAQQAIDQRWTGVIAAGVELPSYHWYQSGFRPHHVNTMHALADGMSLHVAIGQFMASGQTGWVVALVAALRARYIEWTGLIPAPTPESLVIPADALARKRGASRSEQDRLEHIRRVESKVAAHARIAEEVMKLQPADYQPGGGA